MLYTQKYGIKSTKTNWTQIVTKDLFGRFCGLFFIVYSFWTHLPFLISGRHKNEVHHVSLCIVQMCAGAKHSLVHFLSPCSHTSFLRLRAWVCFWCVRESAVCLLSLLCCSVTDCRGYFIKVHLLACLRPNHPPQQISFTPNPGDTAAIPAANSVPQEPAARLSSTAKTC